MRESLWLSGPIAKSQPADLRMPAPAMRTRRLGGALRFRSLVVAVVALAVGAVWPVRPTLASTAPLPLAVNAKAACVLDVDTGRLLYNKHADVPMYPASTTKLMTAILLVTHTHPNDPIHVSHTAARQHRVRLGLRPDTTLTADQALHALLMKSANDVAYAVAETVGGSQSGFARMMNVKARLIGCTNTRFVTPNGLHDDNHVSSAHDIALILAEAIRYPRIVQAMQTVNYTVGRHQVHNGNRMIYAPSTAFGAVIGGKTGFTSKAMYCLAFAVRQHGHVRISVVLGAPRKSLMYRETRRLLTWAYRQPGGEPAPRGHLSASLHD